ncbi:MAG: LysM peptidoglycan-binding domain-containing protein [Anaerolineae bacterium]|nr:LysM peptidoglycan-binding domain-containing protein [Anaerolineae bacterium]MCA9910659.1 LysM peptidoglycan-binding domain-containing protein [Anaerolineae bacterium]
MRRLILVLTVLLMIATFAPAALAQTGTTTYVVQPNDSLTALAARYGVTIDALASANNITVTTRLYVGQSLVIPVSAPSTNTGSYTVQRGDTLASIAQRFNTTTQNLMIANGIANVNRIYAGQVLRVPAAAAPAQSAPAQPAQAQPAASASYASGYYANGYYRVHYGDTMLGIARYFGLSPWAIAQANGIYNLNLIYAGQWLRIPR